MGITEGEGNRGRERGLGIRDAKGIKKRRWEWA